MDISSQLESYCSSLTSGKVTVRRQACMNFGEFLELKETVEYMNECETTDWWNKILSSIQSCLLKENERKLEECRKKGVIKNPANQSADLFVSFVRTASKHNARTLNFRKLLNFITEFLTQCSHAHYSPALIKVLRESFLPHSHIRNSLQSRDWETLYTSLKSLYKNTCNMRCEQYIKCIVLVIRWGPLYAFPIGLYRQQFPFVTHMCQTLVSSSLNKQTEDNVVELVHEFCHNVCKDNRTACCKLGEEVINCMIRLYESNTNDDKNKSRLVDFFRLQVTIHNPKGTKQGDCAAFAVSWDLWRDNLNNIYNVLFNEVERSVEFNTKKEWFVIVKTDVIRKMCDNFVSLFVEVSQQLFSGGHQNTSDEPPKKRPRVEVDAVCLTQQVKTTKSWMWIQLFYTMTETYPDSVNISDYVDALKALISLQIEAKDVNLLYHVHKALVILKRHKLSSECEDLWKSVADSSLRLMGNQNDEQLQKLVQLFLLSNFVTGHENLFHHYSSGSIVTRQKLNTLNVAFQTFGYLQRAKDLKIETMRWILQSRNNRCFRDSCVAEFLVCLTLKQWQDVCFERCTKVKEEKKKLEEIENVYLCASFQKCLTPRQEKYAVVDFSYVSCVDQSMLRTLIELLIDLRKDLGTDDSVMFNFTILCLNVIGFLLKFNVITSEQLDSFELYTLFESCTKEILTNKLTIDTEERRKNEKTTYYVETLNILFGANMSHVLSKKLRQIVPETLIKDMFWVLSQECEYINEDLFISPLKKTTMEALVKFSCLPDGGDLFVIQERAIDCLLETDYDFSNDFDYELVLKLLNTLIVCNPKNLPESIILSIYGIFQKVCEVRYHCYHSVLQMLNLFIDIYPLVGTSKSEACKSQFVQILYAFYTNRLNYGPDVSVCLLNCIGLLLQFDPECDYSTWSGEDIALKLPEFLTSDYQQVRFAAIEVIARFFQISTKIGRLNQYHRQEIMFAKITEMSLQVEEETNEDGETQTRFASILHTFASIMMSSYLWVEEALFTLLKISRDKNIDFSCVKTVVEIVAMKLGHDSSLTFFRKYVAPVVNRWSLSYIIDRFPFQIFNTATIVEFFCLYRQCLSSVIIQSEDRLKLVALNLGKSQREIVHELCTKLLAQSIAQEAPNFSRIKDNSIYMFLPKQIGANDLNQILKSKIEEVVMHLIENVSDESDFQSSFTEPIIFPKVEGIQLTVQQFYQCLQYLEDCLVKDNNELKSRPDKIHEILLQLKLKLHAALALEDKLRLFHLLSTFSLWCLDNVAEQFQSFLIGDLAHTLLHYIKNYRTEPKLSSISCKLFKSVLEKNLPARAYVIEVLFPIIVSRLRTIALENCSISDICVEMLTLIIVDHKKLFVHQIETLDSLPESFGSIYWVYHEIKYQNRTVQLEDEIKQFLDFVGNTDNLDECEHSLTNLKQLLTSRKDELESICGALGKTRDVSLLHHLISLLITLSCSNNHSVSVEAQKCLGEIGPVDLATLVLQPKKAGDDALCRPLQMLLLSALPLLSKYILSGAVEVVEAASKALYQIMSTQEGRGLDLKSDYGFGVPNRACLVPFRANPPQKTNFGLHLNMEAFMEFIQDADLWKPMHENHQQWITGLVCALLKTFGENEFFDSLIGVCRIKAEFCEQIFPFIVYMIVAANVKNVTRLISRQIANFFEKRWNVTLNSDDTPSITKNKASVQCMLNVVDFIRLQRSFRKSQITLLDLNYLKVANAAYFCTAHLTALFYAELWCQEQLNDLTGYDGVSTCAHTHLDLVSEKVDQITADTLQNILRQSYKGIGEIDALLGCGTRHLLNDSARLEHYKEISRWDLVTLTYECQSVNDEVTQHQLIESLKRRDLYTSSLFCADAVQVPNYESLWRLGQWDYNKLDKNDKNDYDKCKFFALKSLLDGDDFSLEKSLNVGRKCAASETNIEGITNFYSNMSRLQCLNEIEDFVQANQCNAIPALLKRWKRQDDIIQNDFQYIEPVQAQRIIVLSEFLKKRQVFDDDLAEAIITTILRYSKVARVEGKPNVAFRIIKNLRRFDPFSNETVAKIACEEAQLYWGIQDVVTAKCILRQLCTTQTLNTRQHAVALKLMGQWMVDSSSENRQTIIKDYFQKSIKLLRANRQTSVDDEKSVLDTFDQLAKFADHEYQEVMTYINSDIFQKKKENVVRTKQSIDSINVKRAPRDLLRAVRIKEKHFEMDEIEIENIETEKNNLLQLALRYYLLNLIGSNEHNDTIFRIISLLLENSNNEVIKDMLSNDLTRIPTYKFINVLPQVTPHISSSDLFSQTMNGVVEQCARDHPYHTLPLILSLAFSNKDREYSQSKAVVNDARMQSAKTLVAKLKRDEKLTNLIERMEFLSEALIELAYTKNDEAIHSGTISSHAKIKTVRYFDNVLLPTCSLSVNKSCIYENVVGIAEFGAKFSLVGGINAPKKISCRGTDGIIRWQLLKGQDDLRQDAVMQQVFCIMNNLFGMNKRTQNFLIRTYKIVPLSMRSGIIEWVDNTMLLGEYLYGGKNVENAHVKYRPNDLTPSKCASLFQSAANKQNDAKLLVFNKICKQLKPVFHKFFETTFLQPCEWYERRKAYILSVATTSMCGYILGIGDRHVNNILIDKSTAQVIHIDFGIAFEQGRVLPTPETVPFRLTRDIVDGMGISGVEGVFRRSCERTVEVLRSHYRTIITILEVLLYDPLYDWTVSTAEAIKRQKDDQDDTISVCREEENLLKDVNVTAERALLRLKAKLQGMESGKLTSVEHQVGNLIQRAMDSFNLCRMFYGWRPYL